MCPCLFLPAWPINVISTFLHRNYGRQNTAHIFFYTMKNLGQWTYRVTLRPQECSLFKLFIFHETDFFYTLKMCPRLWWYIILCVMYSLNPLSRLFSYCICVSLVHLWVHFMKRLGVYVLFITREVNKQTNSMHIVYEL